MNTSQALDQLNHRFHAPGLHFESGRGGHTRAIIETDTCSGEIYLLGAHVTHYKPAGHEPVLFLSRCAQYDQGIEIHGGVPICFPWFGSHPTDATAPMHGLARRMPWQVQHTSAHNGVVTIELSAELEPFTITHHVSFGRTLSMKLQVQNTSTSKASYEAALHTYLAVEDVRHADVVGLQGESYLDKTAGLQRNTQRDHSVRFAGEVDRLYLDTTSACTLTDPGKNRRIKIDKTGSQSTVVWNPWKENAALMKGFEDDEWQEMACIETVNARHNKVMLEPGTTHTMTATITVESISKNGR